MAEESKKACVGDLVICRYDLEYFYYPGSPSTVSQEGSFHMGIVLRLVDEHYMFFERDFVYEILCTDGHVRIFTQWEVEVVRPAKGS